MLDSALARSGQNNFSNQSRSEFLTNGKLTWFDHQRTSSMIQQPFNKEKLLSVRWPGPIHFMNLLTYIARAQISPRLSGSFLGLALHTVVVGGYKHLTKKS